MPVCKEALVRETAAAECQTVLAMGPARVSAEAIPRISAALARRRLIERLVVAATAPLAATLRVERRKLQAGADAAVLAVAAVVGEVAGVAAEAGVVAAVAVEGGDSTCCELTNRTSPC
jgi:hypothetical protein